ncbi:MAG: TIR domain-containing protein [Bryobacteraceae bacterium]
MSALKAVPSHLEPAKSVAEIADLTAPDDSSIRLSLAGATVVFLDLLGLLAWEGERCRLKHQIPSYFRQSLAWYLTFGKPLLANWDRPGTSKTITINNILDTAPYFLKAIEQRRLDIALRENLPAGSSRIQPVGVVVIKDTVNKVACFLHQWDRRAEQYQLIGGRQRPDESHHETAARELREELDAPDLVLGRDYDLVALTATPVSHSEVSRTYGAITEYEFWTYWARFSGELPPLPSDVKWISTAEMRAGRTLAGDRISKLSQLLDGNPKPLEALEDSVNPVRRTNLPLYEGGSHSPRRHTKSDEDATELSGKTNNLDRVVNGAAYTAPLNAATEAGISSPRQAGNGKPISVFISYSHEDERLKKELDKHLSVLKRQDIIRVWHDRMISPGSEWKRDLEIQLNSAELILILVSASFFASEFCYSEEMKEALARHRLGRAVVIPIIVRPTDWHLSPVGHLQALPKDGRAVIGWSNKDEAWANVADGVRRAIDNLLSPENEPA